MPPSFSAAALARLGDGIRRIEDQATSSERDADAILRTAETDAQLAMAPLTQPRAITAACVDLLEMAALAQLGRCEAAVATARRLCTTAREHRLLVHQLLVDFAAGSGAPAPAALVDRRRAVLVVDDIEDARELVAAVLEDAGFVVRTARNGLEAVLAFYDMQPALIVMDVMMPVLDGLEATRLIRTIDASRDARVIAYTAGPLPEEPHVEALFDAVLQKPATPAVMLATVRQLVPA
jgi:two-component system cell cycle response regulator DivK